MEIKENQTLRNNAATQLRIIMNDGQMVSETYLLQPASSWIKISNRIKNDEQKMKDFKKVEVEVNAPEHAENMNVYMKAVHELYSRKNNGFGADVTEDFMTSNCAVTEDMVRDRYRIDGVTVDIPTKAEVLTSAKDYTQALKNTENFEDEKILTTWATYKAVYDSIFHPYWSKSRIMPKRELFSEMLYAIRDDAQGTVLLANKRDKSRAMMDMAEKLEEIMVSLNLIEKPEGFLKAILAVEVMLQHHKKCDERLSFDIDRIGTDICSSGFVRLDEPTDKSKVKIVSAAHQGEGTLFFYNFSSTFDGIPLNSLSIAFSLMTGKVEKAIIGEYKTFKRKVAEFLKEEGVQANKIDSCDKLEIVEGCANMLKMIYENNTYISLNMIASVARSYIKFG